MIATPPSRVPATPPSRVPATPRPRTRLHGAAQAVGAGIAVRVLGLLTLGAAAAAEGRTAHARLIRWDANWYSGIAAHGYGFTRHLQDGRVLSDYAFFPLYPLLERGVHALSGLGYRDAGLAVSWTATALAVWGVFAVGSQVAGRRPGLLLAALWSAAPVAVVLSMAYSEAVFVALSAWSLHAVLQRRWLAAGTLALLAGLTRPLGIAVSAAVVVAVALHLLARDAPRGRGSVAPLVAALLAPAGWIGYVAWVGDRRHDVAGYFAVENGWGNGIDGGRAFGAWIGGMLGDPADPARFGSGLLVVAGLAVLGWLVVLCVRDRVPVPLVVYAIAVVVMSLVTARYFGSKPRYLLPAFPLLLPVATRLAAGRAGWWVVGAAAVVSSAVGAAMLLGSGPP